MKIVCIFLLVVHWYPLATGLPAADVLSVLADDVFLDDPFEDDPFGDLDVEDTAADEVEVNDMEDNDPAFTMTLKKVHAPQRVTEGNVTEEEAEEDERSAFSAIEHANNKTIFMPQEYKGRKGPGGQPLIPLGDTATNIYEGDILLENAGKNRPSDPLKEHLDKMKTVKFSDSKATMPYALFNWHRKIWKSRVIPVDLTSNRFPTSTNRKKTGTVQDLIQEALDTIVANVPCLKFRAANSADKHWLEFFSGGGCYSGIGIKYWKTRAATRISIGFGCHYVPTIIHEVMHALSFPHEQSRMDRNKYVKYYPSRVQSSMSSNFDVNKEGDINDFGTAYDYVSIMHYNVASFAKAPPSHVLENIHDPQMPLSGDVMSPIDIQELKLLYQCQSTASNRGTSYPWSEWSKYQGCMCNLMDKCGNVRVRFCMSTSCYGGGDDGIQEQALPCTVADRDKLRQKVNGMWGMWGKFTTCSGSCGWGIQTRARACNSPAPKSNGLNCPGFSKQIYVCRNKRCSKSTVDTDFSDYKITDPNRWRLDGFTIVSGRIPWDNFKNNKYGAGPIYDHTREVTGTGHVGYYVAATGKGYVRKRIYHLIESPGSQKCLSFYYMLNGENINHTTALSGYIQTSDNNYYNLPFNLAGHHGNYWKRIAMTIPKLTKTYTIYLEANFKVWRESAIAIDDIFFDHNACDKGLNGCKDTANKVACKALAEGGCNDVGTLKHCCFTCQDPKYWKERATSWNAWGDWNTCSATCGTGTKTRDRTCSSSTAKCSGSATESTECTMKSCGTTNPTVCVDTTDAANRKLCTPEKGKQYCISHKIWMTKHCCQTCKTLATTKAPSTICVDTTDAANSKLCTPENGKKFCTSHKKWMTKHCCQTCKTALCKNKKAFVKYCKPSMEHYCKDVKYESFMKDNCCAQCKPCLDSITGKCKKLKATLCGGESEKWMKDNCCQTCKQACFDTAKGGASCEKFKKSGYCLSAHKYCSWMNTNCCGTCGYNKVPCGE